MKIKTIVVCLPARSLDAILRFYKNVFGLPYQIRTGIYGN